MLRNREYYTVKKLKELKDDELATAGSINKMRLDLLEEFIFAIESDVAKLQDKQINLKGNDAKIEQELESAKVTIGTFRLLLGDKDYSEVFKLSPVFDKSLLEDLTDLYGKIQKSLELLDNLLKLQSGSGLSENPKVGVGSTIAASAAGAGARAVTNAETGAGAGAGAGTAASATAGAVTNAGAGNPTPGSRADAPARVRGASVGAGAGAGPGVGTREIAASLGASLNVRTDASAVIGSNFDEFKTLLETLERTPDIKQLLDLQIKYSNLAPDLKPEQQKEYESRLKKLNDRTANKATEHQYVVDALLDAITERDKNNERQPREGFRVALGKTADTTSNEIIKNLEEKGSPQEKLSKLIKGPNWKEKAKKQKSDTTKYKYISECNRVLNIDPKNLKNPTLTDKPVDQILRELSADEKSPIHIHAIKQYRKYRSDNTQTWTLQDVAEILLTKLLQLQTKHFSDSFMQQYLENAIKVLSSATDNLRERISQVEGIIRDYFVGKYPIILRNPYAAEVKQNPKLDPLYELGEVLTHKRNNTAAEVCQALFAIPGVKETYLNPSKDSVAIVPPDPSPSVTAGVQAPAVGAGAGPGPGPGRG